MLTSDRNPQAITEACDIIPSYIWHAMTPDQQDDVVAQLMAAQERATAQEQVAAIEQTWKDRMLDQGYTGAQSKKLSVEFFAGAMAARHATGMENWCPPKWYISILRGDPIT